MTLFDPPDPLVPIESALSADARRTRKRNLLLARGVHPATLRPLLTDGSTCGDCAHHHASGWHNRTYHKCDVHQLGESHSAASDIRVGWPACALFVERVTTESDFTGETT